MITKEKKSQAKKNMNGRSVCDVAVANLAATAPWCVVPRCTVTCEKSGKTCKIYCSSNDEATCLTVQELCSLLSGTCSIACMRDECTVCQLQFDFCNCQIENTTKGVCITCTCECAEDQCLLDCMCECLCACLECGCNCTVCLNRTPICCSVC